MTLAKLGMFVSYFLKKRLKTLSSVSLALAFSKYKNSTWVVTLIPECSLKFSSCFLSDSLLPS